jgi:hypothetical protein
MEGMIKGKFISALGQRFDADVNYTDCGEIPEKVQFPLEHEYGVTLLHFYLITALGDMAFYEYGYEQGVYDRRELN